MDHGDDCHFFYNATCAKGEGCIFRHVAEAKQSDVTCEEWRLGRCLRQNCPLRHSEQANYQQSECFFETQPGGCTKMHCAFVHRFPRNVPSPVSSALPIAAAVRPPQISPVPVAAITSQPAGLHGSQPIAVRPGEVPVRWMAPVQPAAPGVWPRGPPPPGAHMFPPGPHPHYGAFPPGVRPPPLHTEPPHFMPGMPPDMAIRPINPIIINPNEESDLEMSPVKQPIMAHISQPPPTASNPLDYFLNAKPYVAPNPPRFHSRSPSPTGRMSPYRKRGSPTRSQSPSGRVSPYRKRGSVSPARRSPRRSLSPVPRRRSGSMERYEDGLRRRSGSLDRSGSPDRRDMRRFVRRSRSPPRRRSRSPVGQERTRGRAQGILNRFRGGPKRGPKLEEVKVSGRKIVSLKKDKKEEDTDTQQKEEIKQETSKGNKGEAVVAAADKSGAGSSGAGGAVVEEEVKSLEEIYRERALLSMMDAKRKRIQDAKRKRWEGVKDSGDRKSESEKSDKSDKAKTNKKDEGETGESEHSTEEKADNSASEKDSSSEGEEENAGSDIDFNQDVDIELGEGDIIPEPDDQENTQESDHPDTDNSEKITQDQRPKSKRVKPSKSKVSDTKSGQGIKSRLGLRRNDKDTKQRETIRSRSERQIGAKTDKPRSIKDRLGLKPPVTDTSDRNNSSAHDSDSEYDRDSGHDRPVRSGVIKLNKKSSGSNKTNSIFSRLKINRELQAENRRTQNVKNILMVPQITIRNQVEDRKSDIRQRLGLLGEEGSDSDSRKDRKRRRGLDEELLRLLDEEDTSIDYDDLKLLSKKEKKKVLKKLLAQQGREDEYEIITGKKKKKRSFKKRKDKQEDEGESREKRRRINITDRLAAPPVAELDEGSEDEVLEDLQSGDEIQLAEADPPSKESSREPSPHRESDDNKSSEEDAADTVDTQQEQTTVLEIVETDSKQTKAEKAAQLRQALQPKSIQDIRRERAVKKAQGEEVRKIQISTGPSKRKIIIAGEEKKVVEKSEPPVRITFGGFDAAPRRKLSRLADTIDNTDSMKLGRRQRQIYVPPMKKSDEPVAKKPLKVTQGREIIDYSDMFPKKSTSVSDLNIKKITTKATPAQPDTDSTRAPVRLNRGPPKVEVKDATVKTFTEIMAEKKRKRLEAQQAANKPAYKPIVFDDQDASNDSTQGSKPHITSATEERLSPIKSQHSSIESTFNPVKYTSSPVKASPVKANPVKATDLRVNLKKTNSSNSLNPSTDSTVKPTRWKRKKLSEQNVAADVNSSSKADLQSANVTSGSETFSETSKAVVESRLDKVEDPQPTVLKETSLTSKTPPESQTSTHESAEIDTGPVKKARISDSFLDFDDDLLKLDDDDDELELDADQDHDELMREIDELLA